jgi:hypothetical protein
MTPPMGTGAQKTMLGSVRIGSTNFADRAACGRYPAGIADIFKDQTVSRVDMGCGLSAAAKRRSGWGSVLDSPALSSHFSPGLAPQVGQLVSRIESCWAVMTTLCSAAQ